MVKKRSLSENITVAEEIVMSAGDAPEVTANEEENSEYEDLLAEVQDIRKESDLVGYILKSETKATIDLEDSSKIIEYAMLSSQAFESSETITNALKLGDIKNILIEGKTVKALCVNMGQNKLSIFMQKTADHADILKTLLAQ
jgi:predicted regulator of Ras-like GTPase activity (Roadblock/LC7/MglB family)